MHLLGALKESLPIPHPLGEKGLILRPGLLSWEQIDERKANVQSWITAVCHPLCIFNFISI